MYIMQKSIYSKNKLKINSKHTKSFIDFFNIICIIFNLKQFKL
jgi:hypothetical protein